MLKSGNVAILFFLLTTSASAQQPIGVIKDKPLHLGIAQGIGTNGLHDLSYRNHCSFNLLSGQSFGNHVLLISGLTHFIQQEANGLLITGFSSVVGGYPFLERSRDVDSLARFQAIQISGFMNAVHGNGFGAQVSAAFNLVSDNLAGVQLSGLGNRVGHYFEGVQLAGAMSMVGHFAVGLQLSGLANTAESLSGVQVALLSNTVRNDLDGIQLGAVNYAGNVKSTVYRNNRFYWLQSGILNIVKSNSDGTQFGLVNFGKDVGFAQIGLINLSVKAPQYPVGLLNLSATGSYFLRAYANSRFWSNIEFASGSDKLLNGVSYSFGRTDGQRAIGYHLGKLRYWGWNNFEFFEDLFVSVNFMYSSFKDLLDPKPAFAVKYERGYNPFVLTKGIDLFLFAGLSYNLQPISISAESAGWLSWEMGGVRSWFDLNIGIQM